MNRTGGRTTRRSPRPVGASASPGFPQTYRPGAGLASSTRLERSTWLPMRDHDLTPALQGALT